MTLAPNSPPSPNDSIKKHKTYILKWSERRKQLERCGLKRDDNRKNLRIYYDHEYESIKYRHTIVHSGKKKHFVMDIIVPKAYTPSSLLSTIQSRVSPNKGVGRDRMNARILRDADCGGDENNDEKSSDHQSWALQCQMMAEEKECSDELSSDILMACGMLTELKHLNIQKDMKLLHLRRGITIKNQRQRKRWSAQGPAVRPGEKSNKDIKVSTNFESENEMMVYIILVCNGDWERMTESVTGIMTWFEEWYFYFEFMWGRTMTTWNVATMKNAYGMNESYLRRVFDSKLRIMLCARESWPTYCSLEEDKKLMKKKWKDRYGSARIIQWDNTDVRMTKLGNADMQRTTYSSYYSSNCAKGAVMLQLCGWMGAKCLFPGGISDSEYMIKSGIFEEQMDFAIEDVTDNVVTPFCNETDKGYRCVENTYRLGKQLMIQPDFAKADCHFKGKETLTSAAIATDRSRNERAVRLSKQSGYINRGIPSAGSPLRMDNAWMSWSFQCNFMFESVL